MEPPKCKTCGERHWERVCQNMGPTKRDAQKTKATPPIAPPITQAAPKPQKTQSIEKPLFDRVAYQREYMRKRRAAAKAKDK